MVHMNNFGHTDCQLWNFLHNFSMPLYIDRLFKGKKKCSFSSKKKKSAYNLNKIYNASQNYMYLSFLLLKKYLPTKWPYSLSLCYEDFEKSSIFYHQFLKQFYYFLIKLMNISMIENELYIFLCIILFIWKSNYTNN